jgi:hypothetical protein
MYGPSKSHVTRASSKALAGELVDPLVLALRQPGPEAHHTAGGRHQHHPSLRCPRRFPGPPLAGDLARQQEPVAPEGAQDFQVPRLRSDLLSELAGRWVLVSKEEQALVLVDGEVAVGQLAHADLRPNSPAFATQLRPNRIERVAKSLETVRALRTRTPCETAGNAARSHFCAPTGRSGDGGNRTRVRGLVTESFYKLSRRLNLASRRPRRPARPGSQPS